MNIRILQLIDGARRAEGLTVIIDVFRAFTTECYAFAGGCTRSYPIGKLEDAFAMKAAHPDYILLGERGGAKVEGCDLGNSPYDVTRTDFLGKCMIHSTSAGTQGIVAAASAGATEIVTGSLVNARAVTDYISSRKPETVSIVAMGKAGLTPTTEDLICAHYMAYLLSDSAEQYRETCRRFREESCGMAEAGPEAGLPVEHESFASILDYIGSLGADGSFSIQDKIAWLRDHGGEQFFDPALVSIFPREDYPLCVDYNKFNFVLKVKKNEQGSLEISRSDI